GRRGRSAGRGVVAVGKETVPLVGGELSAGLGAGGCDPGCFVEVPDCGRAVGFDDEQLVAVGGVMPRRKVLPATKIRVCDGRLGQTPESSVGGESASSHERSPGSS